MRSIKILLPLLLLCLNCGTVDRATEANPTRDVAGAGGEENVSGAGGVSGDSSVGGQNVGGLSGNSDVDCHRGHREWCDSKTHECHKCSHCHQ